MSYPLTCFNKEKEDEKKVLIKINEFSKRNDII